MAHVVVAPTASDDLDRMIEVLNLPRDTRHRVSRRLPQLMRFPEGGQSLLIVYVYDEAADQVSVVTIQDARSGRSATSRA